jgi:hypothetical protein
VDERGRSLHSVVNQLAARSEKGIDGKRGLRAPFHARSDEMPLSSRQGAPLESVEELARRTC